MYNNILLFIGIIFPFLINALGALFVFFPFGKKGKKHAVAFSAGIMMGASFWSLLLPASETFANTYGKLSVLIMLSAFLLGGAFICLTDIVFSLKRGEKLNSSFKLFIAVTAHNFPEGLTVGFALGSLPIISALAVSFGIAVQNFPEGLAVALLYKDQPNGNLKGFKMGVLSAIVEPVGSVIGLLLCSMLTVVQPFVLCFSAGAMIYVCVSELIPSGCISGKGVFAFNVGFCIMTFLDLVLS